LGQQTAPLQRLMVAWLRQNNPAECCESGQVEIACPRDRFPQQSL